MALPFVPLYAPHVPYTSLPPTLLSISEVDTPDTQSWADTISISCTAVLASFIALSLLFLTARLISHWRGGQIKLGAKTDSNAPLTLKQEVEQKLLEYIDQRTVGDGEPVGLRSFWTKVGVAKAALCVVSACFVGVQLIPIVFDAFSSATFGQLIINLTMSSYILILSLVNLCAESIPTHRVLIMHTASLTVPLLLSQYFRAFGEYLLLVDGRTPWYDWVLLAFSFSLVFQAILIPLGPLRHKDLAGMYNRAVNKVIEKEPVDGVPNVVARDDSSILDILLLNFMYPIMWKISKLEQVDIPDLPAIRAYVRAQTFLPEAMRKSRRGSSDKPVSAFQLVMMICRAQSSAFILAGILCLALVPAWYIPLVFQEQILWLLDVHPDRRMSVIAFAILFCVTKCVPMIMSIQRTNLVFMTIQPRSKLQSSYLLYQKLLSRNMFASAERKDDSKRDQTKLVYSKAEILNLMSTDTSQLAELPVNIMELATGQIEMIVGCFYLWKLLGVSGAWGIATMFLTWPVAFWLTKVQYNITEKQIKLSDDKLALMNEAVQAISMIKMTASEPFWFNRVKDVRDKQFNKDIQANIVNQLSTFLYEVTPILVTIVSFAHYTLIAKKELTASIAFTSLAVFAELRPLLNDLPSRIADLLQQILSVKRIAAFLSAQDIERMTQPAPPTEPDQAPRDDLFVNATVAWDLTPEGTAKGFQLQDVDVHFPRGKMTLISGRVGSGKTLLLLALLGEARVVSGDISYVSTHIFNPHGFPGWRLDLHGVAYTPQTAWLQSMSIRENILFGLPLEIERYRNVLFACALLPDLAILEDGDLTEIGERGKILSGGQKARVSLARAVYSRAATVLLDDVISAVDAQTSRHIIENCFKSDLMSGRTVIIASHAVEALAPMAEHAMYLDNGRVLFEGTGEGLMESEHMEHLKSGGIAEEENIKGKGKDIARMEAAAPNLDGQTAETYVVKEQTPKTPRQLIVEERREKGEVKISLWMDLAKANGGALFWTIAISGIVLTGLLLVAGQEVLSLWTRDATLPGDLKKSNEFWLILYSVISIGTVFLTSAGWLFRFFGAIRATKKYHAGMLDHMLRAKLAFFTKTKAGSIIQRFGPDLIQIKMCSLLISNTISLGADIITSVITVSVYGGWMFPVLLIVIGISFFKYGNWFVSAARQLQRLNSIIPGGVNAIYGETVAGAAVIRAFGAQAVFVNDLQGNLTMRSTAWLWTIYTTMWLAALFYALEGLVLAIVLTLLLWRPGTTGAEAGFVLFFSRIITSSSNWLILKFRDFQSKGVNIERVAEYCRLLVEETVPLDPNGNDPDVPAKLVKPDWPLAGAMEVRTLHARYGPDLPDILHGVSFDIDGGQRVGIVGATGGGKSTLAKAFFSFVELSGGKIEIDGTDISTLPLGQVRSSIGMIAQDPVLLSGTLRLNLDIDGQFKDEALFAALRQVQLLRSHDYTGAASETSSQTAVEGTEETASVNASVNSNENIFADLDSEIKSGGENLSAGQKQLVVLARALLNRQRILILDEATASIDSATDAEISRVVHEEFNGVTVLIIAHRLRTIMPCSKILVMDNGRLIQQGSPLELINVDGGKFQSLCMAAGPDEYAHLRALAEQSAKSYEVKLIDL